MVDEIDIWRTAKLLTDQHGDKAAIHAAMRSDELLETGDLEGSAAAHHQGHRGTGTGTTRRGDALTSRLVWLTKSKTVNWDIGSPM